jgi:hypothetical protein
MSNSFYNHGAFPSTGSAATSASMRAELDLVAAGFDKMPTLSGNANKFIIVNSTGTALTQTDVLPAFTVTDTDFTVQDDGDNTRKFQFNAGSITTGNTRVYVMPDLDTTLVGTNVTQTLTNKTLTAPVIATIVNTGTLTLPTSTDTLVGRNTTDTLTNKTLTNPVIGTIVNTGTLTLPTSTDTLVGRQTTDTLTNKTISGASNTLSNIANGSLSNSSIVIGSTTLSLGGTMTTLAGVTISGASNTLSNIANASLTNSSITINGSTVALGSSVTVTATATNALTIGNGLSGTSYNGSSAVTIAINTGVTADLSTAQTFSNKTISGSANTLSNIANASLTNSAITIGSTAISLGATSLTLAGLTSASATTLISTGNQATSVAISAIGHSSGTVTVTTSTAHGLTTGDTASIDGVADYSFCGVYTVTVTNANVFTYSQTASGASSSGGFSTKLNGTWGLYAGGTGPSLANGPVMINASSQMPALRVTQGGSGYALIVEDAANPDTSAFIISNAGDLAINTNKFTVAAASGNTVIAGTTSLNGNVTFATDATYDIGASGATRPRDLFLSRNLVVGGTLTLAGGVNLNGNVTIGDASTDTLTINATITSNLIFTDNTYDIGASGATRPRTLYLGTSLITPAITNSGLTSGRVTFASTGGLLADSANLTWNGTTFTASNLATPGVVQFSTNAAQSAGSLAKNATYGLSLYGITGSTYDLVLLNNAGNVALGINTGTTTVNLPGALTVGGNVTLSGGVANTIPFLNGSKVVTTSTSAGGLAWTGQIMGIGSSSSAWGNAFNGLQVTNGTSYVRGGGNSSHAVNNVYNDNTNWRYIGNAAAAQLILGDGNISLQTAATGTSGNVVTFGTGIYIDQLGEGVGLFGSSAAIPTGMASFLALGDNDTGIAWETDGAIHTYVNNVKTLTYYSGATISQQQFGIFRSPSYPLDVGGNARIMGVTAYNDNILRMSLPSGTSGNVNQILFREQADTVTTASITAYGSAYGSNLNYVLRFGTAAGYAMIGQAGVFGIQTIPSTDWSTASVIQIEQASVIGSADATRLMQGTYFATTLGGAAARLNGTYAPSMYLQNGGAHNFYSSAVGSAGSAISWTPLGTFNANGILSLQAAALNWDGAQARAFETSASSGLRGCLYQSASGVTGVANNYYYNGGDLRGGSGNSTRYYQLSGQHFFQVAASGAANSGITWVNGLQITNNGTLLATGDAATDGNIKGMQTGNGFVERDYQYNSGGSLTIVVSGQFNYKFEITVLSIGNTAAASIGEGRWIAGRRDYAGANHLYGSDNLVNSCVSFSTSQSIVGNTCTYTITVTNTQDGANKHFLAKVRLVGSDSFSITN